MRTSPRQRLTVAGVALTWALFLRLTILTYCGGEGRPRFFWEPEPPVYEWVPDVVLDPDLSKTDPVLVRLRLDFEAARAKWDEVGPSDYVVVIEYSCFCGPEDVHPRRIVVRDGDVAEVAYVEVAGRETPDLNPRGTTIDELFDRVLDLRRRRPARLEVRYDPLRGFPTDIVYDATRQGIDDEWSLTVREFEALEDDRHVDRAHQQTNGGTGKRPDRTHGIPNRQRETPRSGGTGAPLVLSEVSPST